MDMHNRFLKCLAGFCLLMASVQAEITVQLKPKSAMNVEGIKVWILPRNPELKAYGSKNYYLGMKPRFTDARGKVQAEELSIRADQELRILITDPRVELVDVLLSEPPSSGSIPIAISPRELNGELNLDFSSIDEEGAWKRHWKLESAHTWMISMRVHREGASSHQHLVRVQGEALELYGLKDGSYRVEMLTFSKFRGGGDIFLFPLQPEMEKVVIKDGKLVSAPKLQLREMRP